MQVQGHKSDCIGLKTALFSLHSKGNWYIIVGTIKSGEYVMIKEASKIAQLIVEFCRNNLDILMIGGVALIVLVIIISVVRSSRDGGDEDLDFDEFARVKTEAKTEDEVKAAAEAKVAAETSKEPKSEAKPTVEEVPERTEKKNTPYIEGLLGELAGLSQDGIKELEIKIQGAEVKITYGNSGDSGDSGNLDEEANEELREELVEETSDETLDDEIVDKEDDSQKEEVKQAVITSGKVYKKFGPENNNISKSGRIYTEEELEEQIRD